MGWEGILEALPSCGVLGGVIGFLVFFLRRETAEKTFWRDKALAGLDLGEKAAGVARDFAEEAQ